mmetsp:Transcript_6151/g.7590  ORF Transcript_6151/g.7590 Transcript_6151/m.7590 type:complete len:99 (-) Transcript_6151:500-796(-)|eukprot:CAMPEP_0206184262 /NCGR_PEP_ID=MMETSP0166-20121206/1123_1 /ASSEMBLY_ACC=CAM_ASM_000260 /TAXON_ID=95228 /ORGANISM="Vannella robusta, Strain DIVA3 518/3/11/1/6" /LENGTH=98 /DNA_ID=CAMNT_0053599263 /DNA_START=388 /DNA_END=684 /DNA_ORIENTATION=+
MIGPLVGLGVGVNVMFGAIETGAAGGGRDLEAELEGEREILPLELSEIDAVAVKEMDAVAVLVLDGVKDAEGVVDAEIGVGVGVSDGISGFTTLLVAV